MRFLARLLFFPCLRQCFALIGMAVLGLMGILSSANRANAQSGQSAQLLYHLKTLQVGDTLHFSVDMGPGTGILPTGTAELLYNPTDTTTAGFALNQSISFSDTGIIDSFFVPPLGGLYRLRILGDQLDTSVSVFQFGPNQLTITSPTADSLSLCLPRLAQWEIAANPIGYAGIIKALIRLDTVGQGFFDPHLLQTKLDSAFGQPSPLIPFSYPFGASSAGLTVSLSARAVVFGDTAEFAFSALATGLMLKAGVQPATPVIAFSADGSVAPLRLAGCAPVSSPKLHLTTQSDSAAPNEWQWLDPTGVSTLLAVGDTLTEGLISLVGNDSAFVIATRIDTLCGLMASDTFIFVALATPTADFTAVASTGCAPFSITTQNLSVNATTYEWLVNGVVVSTAFEPTINLPSSNLGVDTTHEIILAAFHSDPNAPQLTCTDTAAAVQMVVPAATTIVGPNDTAICTGGSVVVSYQTKPGATLLVTATSALNFTSGFTSTSTNASFTDLLTYVGPAFPNSIPDTVTYTAVAMLNGCASAESFFKVIVHPAPVVSINYLSLQSICSGDSAKVTFTGGATYQYTLISSGGVTGASGGTNPNLTQKLINNGTRKDTVTWEVRGFNAFGCVGRKDTVAIEVLAQVDAYSLSGPDSVCAGVPFTLGGPTFDSTGRPLYQWLKSSVGLTGPFFPIVGKTDTDLVETINAPAWYRRVSFGPQGQCPELSPVKSVVLFPGVTSNSILGSQTLCANALTQLSPIVGVAVFPAGSVIQWEVSNDLGASWVPIAGANALSYVIDPLLLSFPVALGQTAETRFRRTITAYGCASFASNEAIILVRSAPRDITFTLPSPTADSACAGSKGVHVAVETQPGALYRWTSDPPGATINGINSPVAVIDVPVGANSFVVTCTLTDQVSGCKRIASLTLPLRQLNILPPGQVALASGNTLTYLGSRAQSTSFQWGYDDLNTLLPTEIPGATTWNYSAGPLFNPDDFAYWVRVDDGECSTLAYYNRPATDITVGLADEIGGPTASLTAPVVFPNPSPSGSTIRLAVGEGPAATISLTDLMGRSMSLTQAPQSQRLVGGKTHELTLGVGPGLYVLRIAQGDQAWALKLVVE